MEENKNFNAANSGEIDDNELDAVSGGVLNMNLDPETLKRMNEDSQKLTDYLNSASQNAKQGSNTIRENLAANYNKKAPSQEELSKALDQLNLLRSR